MAGMEIRTGLFELIMLHPRLIWHDLIAAVAAVLGRQTDPALFTFEFTIEGVRTFDDPSLRLVVELKGIDGDHVARLLRTYEPSRLVEMAAIAIAGVVIYHAAHVEIRDMALRGSGADYLVGAAGLLLEIGGRSRRRDLESAWQQKWDNLSQREAGRFFLCVVEFETLTGRLAFQE
jgi:hypothetical protein